MTPPLRPFQAGQFSVDAFRGIVIGTYLAATVGVTLASTLMALHPLLALFVALGMAGAVAGAIQGWLLGAVIRSWLLWMGCTISCWVVPPAIIGFGLVLMGEAVALQLWYAALLGIGMMIGITQWLLIRRSQPHASWWLVCTAGTWAVMPVVAPLFLIFSSPMVSTWW